MTRSKKKRIFEICYVIWTVFFGLYDMAQVAAGTSPVVFFASAAAVQWLCLAFWYFIWKGT